MYRTVFTICTAQWSLYVPHCGHHMYRTVVTICTAQWSPYVPHSGHYMYRTAVTICTAQWSPYVTHSGHYMYRTVGTICTAQWSLCTAQWSLYVPHSGHYMYRTAVTICTAQWSLYVPPSLTFNNSTFCPHSVFMCFVWIWEQTAIISLYNINWLAFITETECVYCAVRTGYIYIYIYIYICNSACSWPLKASVRWRSELPVSLTPTFAATRAAILRADCQNWKTESYSRRVFMYWH